jgi:hypothetical protein
VAEVTFLVDDAYHGRGIGTLLLEHLAGLARDLGIRRLCADTLAENVPMLDVFAHSGFDQLRAGTDGMVMLTSGFSEVGAFGHEDERELDAIEMLRSLRCAPLLAGYRGIPAADRSAVLDVLHRLARLAELIPEIAGLDINPLVAARGGAVAIDIRARLSPAPAQPDPYARRLR